MAMLASLAFGYLGLLLAAMFVVAHRAASGQRPGASERARTGPSETAEP